MDWYYAIGEERRGPVTEAQFEVLVSNGTIRPNTLIWRQGMADWSPYASLTGGTPSYTGETGMRYAGFWIRFAAKLIDYVILSVVGFVIGIVGGIAGSLGSPPAEIEMIILGAIYGFSFLLNVLYYTLFVGAYGATPGKMAIGLRVVCADGSPVSYLRALGRYFAAALNYFTLMFGWFMAGWTREKTALHDLICDTRVIQTN